MNAPVLTSSFSLQKALQWSFAAYVVSMLTTLSGMEIFSWLTCLLTVVQISVDKKKWHWPIITKPLLGFILVLLAGIFLHAQTTSDLIYDLGRLRFFLLFFVLYQFMISYFDFKSFLGVLLVVCGVVGVYGFIQHFYAFDLIRPEGKKVLLYAIQEKKIGPLVVGFFNHHLTFSNISLLWACLWMALGVSRTYRPRWSLFMGGLFFLLTFWTQSRVAWVATFILVLFMLGYHSKKLFGLALCGMILFGLGVYQLDAGFSERFDRTFLGKKTESPIEDEFTLGPRKRLWVLQWHFFKESPILGVGYNNNERRAREMTDKVYPGLAHPFYGHAHSTPLQILATTGLLGTFFFGWVWGLLFSKAYQLLQSSSEGSIEKAIGLAGIAAFIGFLIQGLTQWNFGDAEVLHNILFFWLLILSTAKLHNASIKRL